MYIELSTLQYCSLITYWSQFDNDIFPTIGHIGFKDIFWANMEASVFEYSVPRLQKRITFVSEVLIRVIFSDLTARLLVGNIMFYRTD